MISRTTTSSSPAATPDISVVVPTFRRPRPLLEAVRSALSQDGVSIEVIVTDDSTEGSARAPIAALGDPRVLYLQREVPSGGNPSRVRNEGARHARGRFIHFLDDDDRVIPGAYRDVVRTFQARPDIGVVYGHVLPFGQDAVAVARENRVFARAARRARLYERLGLPLLVVANQLFSNGTVLVNSACVVRREHFAKLGGYDEELCVVEDLEFYIRAIRSYGCTFLDRPIIGYRTGEPSLMNAAMAAGTPVPNAYRRIYQKYRADHGAAELFSMKLVGKALLRWL